MRNPGVLLWDKKRWFSIPLFLWSILYAPLSLASSEANLVLPNLGDTALASFLGGMAGSQLLTWGLLVCVAGLVFGAVIYGQIKSMPVHRSMAEVSELIYETCKTYMQNQGKFILLLEVFIGIIIVAYFGWVQHMAVSEVLLILAFSLKLTVLGLLILEPIMPGQISSLPGLSLLFQNSDASGRATAHAATGPAAGASPSVEAVLPDVGMQRNSPGAASPTSRRS